VARRTLPNNRKQVAKKKLFIVVLELDYEVLIPVVWGCVAWNRLKKKKKKKKRKLRRKGKKKRKSKKNRKDREEEERARKKKRKRT